MMRIRLPADVKSQLAARAKENGRSMNSEVLMILKGTLEPRPATKRTFGKRNLDNSATA
jgi:plasmid stability protein